MNVEFRTSENRDTDRLKCLWLLCFDDSPEAAELFFERNKDTYHAYVAQVNGEAVSALYLIDCKLCGENAHYLCGAATMPEFRKRGIMGGLIEYSLNDAKRRGDRYSVLLPASESLYRFYSGHGYRTCCSMCRTVKSRFELERDRADSIRFAGNADFEQMQNGFEKDNFLLWNNNYIRFAVDYYACYGVKTAFSQNALAIYEEEHGVCCVIYSIYNDIKELNSLLIDNSAAKKFVIIGKSGEMMFKNSKKEKYGMARALTSKPLPNDIYIGITLE
jgi:GNAT superfamily N-acetyltransferase